MKKTFPFILALLILAACSATPTPAPTVDLIPSATLTIIPPTETLMATLTVAPAEVFDPATMDKPQEIMSTDPVENVTHNGVTINGAFTVAESAYQAGVHEVTMPDALGAEILSEAAFTLYYYHGPNPHRTTDVPTDADRIEFFTIWKEVQAGTRPCADIQVTPFAFDANVSGLEQQQMPLEIMCGAGEVSEGARQIDKIEIEYTKLHGKWNDEKKVFEKNEKYPRAVLTGANSMGNGFETELEGTTLRIKAGIAYKLNDPQRTLAALTSVVFDWLRENNGQPTQKSVGNVQDVNTGDKWIGRGFIVKSRK